jgi:hypothetical protein
LQGLPPNAWGWKPELAVTISPNGVCRIGGVHDGLFIGLFFLDFLDTRFFSSRFGERQPQSKNCNRRALLEGNWLRSTVENRDVTSMAEAGVLLRWNPPVAEEESAPMVVHIRRVVLFDRLTDETEWLSTHSSLEQNLFIEDGSQSVHALDKDVRHGYTYDYQAQYVAQLPVSKQTVLELRGPFSAPACIHMEKAVVSDSSARSVPVSECP